MKTVLGWIFNRWVLGAVAFLAFALAVWVIGPLVAVGEWRPLDRPAARLWVLGTVLALIVFAVVLARWRSRRGNTKVVQALVDAPAGPADSADLAAVRQRFEKALATLQRARFGPAAQGGGLIAGWKARLSGRYLYELPWYLIIGAPGSGKTTALRHSGLQFPLGEQDGDAAVRGVGGTRHCDWWFTDRAVLIDTAGRFTTQDSDREADRATWAGFLAMLKRSRPRQPLNGALVTVSLTDLLARSPAERAAHAATVRARVQELHEHLGHRFPLYLLVTKCDLMAGFTESFESLDKTQRTTPWGFTFAPDEPQSGRGARLQAELEALQQRLLDGLIPRLQAERDPGRRARVYGFPGQFAALRAPLQEFVEGVFSPSPFEADPMLRGVYFVSGTQEGTPIDRLLGSVARAYRLERAMLPPLQASGRSYFLTRLLDEVVFAEQGLAGHDQRWERRRRWLGVGAGVTMALLTVGLLSAWGVSAVNNRRYVDEVAARAQDVRALLQTTPNRASPDLLPLLPALDATRRLAIADPEAGVPWSLGLGLYQGRKLDAAARAAYERMLVDAVQPRLALRVEEELRQGDAPDTQYEALKAYLMLHDPQRFDAAALKAYVEAGWDLRLGRDLSAEQREGLSAHLDALLALGPTTSPLPEDRALVTAARTRLAGVTLPQRIYHRLRHQGLGAEFPEFTVIRAAGNEAAVVFTRTSGQPLTRGVPGLFSYDGYHQGFQKQVGAVTRQLAEEQPWVLGITEAPGTLRGALSGDGTADEVRRLYLNDYVQLWEAFIADVRIQPMTTVAQSVQTARLLAAPGSPLKPLLKAMSRETTLLAAPTGAVDKAGSKLGEVIKEGRERLARELGAAPAPNAAPGTRIESIVDERFRALRDLVQAGPDGKAPIDQTVGLIGEAYVMLNAAETALKGGAAPPPSPVPARLKAEAPTLPEPAKSLVEQLADASGKVTKTQEREILGREVKAQVGEFCVQALSGRYPLDRGARRDATPADFAALFGPGGRMETLFNQRLAPYVDTTARPWKFRAVDGTPLGTDVGSLPQFQRAQAIREVFFPAGAAQPTLRLELKPVEMDPKITQFTLDVDGQVLRYAHGPQIPMTITWPGPRGTAQVRAQAATATASPPGLLFDGPWALYRLFDGLRVDPGPSPERFRATFDFEGRKVVFEVTAASVRNPFGLRELREFACPTGL